MKRIFKLGRGLFLALATLASAPLVANAVLVASHAVFIDHNRRTGHITLANPGDHPEEIKIDFMFGYPATDSVGRPYVELIENPGPEDPSAADWLRAFPHRLRLEPGQRQVVRILASPPADVPDGEHWSRLIVTSRRAAPIAATDHGIRAGITFELRTIMSVNYRKGIPETRVSLTDLRGSVEGDSLVTWIGLEREGNAAFLGSLGFQVCDHGGLVMREWQVPVAVYYRIHRRLALPLDALPGGKYQVKFLLSTSRTDIPRQNILDAPSISRSFSIEVD